MCGNIIFYLKTIFQLIIFFFIFINPSFSNEFSIGQKIQKNLKVNKYFNIDLPDGDWEVVRKTTFNWRTINQRIIGIGRVN